MKLISFTVPCYNSAAYMKNCLESLLIGGDEVEIIIVDDGSTDDTPKIADAYAEEYPDIVRVIHKENGGHGSAINAGLEAAQGLYFKVVDSDDLVGADAYKYVLDKLKNHRGEGIEPDLYVTNFIYNRENDNMSYVSRYADKITPERVCDFSHMKTFRFSRMFLMHSLMYKRSVLIESGVKLPEHTFYVDEIFAFVPLPYVKKLYYMDVDFYIYNIGRADQSVTKKNMFARYEQQIRVMLRMTDAYTYDTIKKQSKGLKKYMFHALPVVMLCTIYFICGKCEKERKLRYKEMWAHIKQHDKKLYYKLRYRTYVLAVNFLPWRLRFFVMDKSYDYLCKKICLGV